VSAGHLIGSSERQRDLLGVSASSNTRATASSTVAAATDRQAGVVSRSAREEHS
jgi:hypothetical protein